MHALGILSRQLGSRSASFLSPVFGVIWINKRVSNAASGLDNLAYRCDNNGNNDGAAQQTRAITSLSLPCAETPKRKEGNCREFRTINYRDILACIPHAPITDSPIANQRRTTAENGGKWRKIAPGRSRLSVDRDLSANRGLSRLANRYRGDIKRDKCIAARRVTRRD